MKIIILTIALVGLVSCTQYAQIPTSLPNCYVQHQLSPTQVETCSTCFSQVPVCGIETD